MRDAIEFSLRVAMRCPKLKIDEQTKTLIARDDYDFESIPIFRTYKL